MKKKLRFSICVSNVNLIIPKNGLKNIKIINHYRRCKIIFSSGTFFSIMDNLEKNCCKMKLK